eukprot:TRINITY_DN6099_c0_g1_i1.p1 TRINITY_DN6099_c0_g1~~TRINITY_DN6099_c0_g1_i1.p1  ORF type:complete len:713 (+),score=177.86 TRINITY_DN6099_c0_g1_i1:19-2157(+)
MDELVKKPAPPPVPNRSGRPTLAQSGPKELTNSPQQQHQNPHHDDPSLSESNFDPSSPALMLQRVLAQNPNKLPPVLPISDNATLHSQLNDTEATEISKEEKQQEPEQDQEQTESEISTTKKEEEKGRKHVDNDKKKDKDKKKKKHRKSRDPTENDKISSSQTNSATTSELELQPITEQEPNEISQNQTHPTNSSSTLQQTSHSTPLPRFSSLSSIPRLRIDTPGTPKTEDHTSLLVEETTPKTDVATIRESDNSRNQGSEEKEEEKEKGREGGRKTPRQHSATCLRSKSRSKEKHQVIKSKPIKSTSELPLQKRVSQEIEATPEDKQKEKKDDNNNNNNNNIIIKDPKSMDKQRQKILEEILITEKDYVADLYIIIDVFLKPLQELCKTEKSVLPRDIQFIFSNVEVIVHVNHQFLNDLEDLLKDSPDSAQDINTHSVKIGNVFLNMANYFKAYTQYCANQPNTTRTLEECKKNVPFQNFLKTAEADPRCRRLSLFSFLIKPIQRICKYPLFMKDIVKNTATEDEAYPVFTSALQKIEEVVEYVNNHKKDSEEKMKVYDIQQSLESLPPEVYLVDPARRLKKEGDVLLHSDKKSVECRAFLFNDQVVFAVKKGIKSNRPRLVYKGRITFSLNTRVIVNESSCRVVDGEGGKEKDFTFFCPQSFDNTQQWIQELKTMTRPFQIQKMSGDPLNSERRTLAGTRGLTSQSAMMR